MKAKNTSRDLSEDPLAKGRDLSKLKRLGRARDLGKVVSREALDPRNIKVHISIKVDADVLEWFKARAADPSSAGYQTLINNALREVMEQEEAGTTAVSNRAALLADEGFLSAVAERVAARILR